MSAICGMLNFDRGNEVDRELLQQMLNLLKHRGNDEEGIYIDNNIGFACGCLRISDTEGGGQPALNEDRTIQVIIDGGIYDRIEWKESLEKKGHILVSSSSAEILVHLYEELGDSFIAKVEGEFAFALWDCRKRKLILARDNAGHKPLYYLLKKGGITFGSEIKSILCDRDYERRINLKALDNFFIYNYVPWPETIFKGIKQVPPGHILTCCDNNVSVEAYWKFSYRHGEVYPENYYAERLYKEIEDAVRRRLEVDAPCGAFLSGGLDSSTIVGLMSSILDEPVKTFCVGFEEERYSELPAARIVADHFGTEHHEFIVKPEMIPALIPKIVWHYDSPLVDTSCIPTYFGGKLAQEHVKLVLTGDGPDQLLAGSGHHPEWNLRAHPSMKNTILSPIRRQFAASLAEHLPVPGIGIGFAHRLKRRVYREFMTLERQFVESGACLPTLVKSKLYSDKMREIQKANDPFQVVEPFFSETAEYSFLDRVLYFDVLFCAHDDLMVKVDRMTMANTLETRSPFQDIKVMDFIGTVPTELKLKGLKNPIRKYILKKAITNLLPEATLKKTKQGFAIPLDEWLRNYLADFILEILLDTKTLSRGYFEEKPLRKLVSRYLAGQTDYFYGSSACIIALLTFEIWNRIFIDARQPNGYSL